ncbi:hypothetical protein ADL25_43945 [Streptomyces sp. NRRL F-5122]|uniref:hypothetical protein n=1 Tax=Streptomyces sp. NRRL F-5122 TaxID=1609098 RepID=UPI000740F495|nr:hypothetical protein [Streptomyces sp. NRRL F-5122]KUJ33743.1 hypothetical protein ADL25_43945 [Streptomyces sp. NRRL F-5122]
MTVQIAPQAVMILVIGCIVGLVVYRHTARTHTGAPARGDLVGAIGTAVGVITVLALLLGMGGAGETAQGPTPGATAPTSSAPRLP